MENYNDINSMSGIEFEFLCKTLLEKMGFETVTTKASGDGGIDLIAYNHQPILSGKYIIQCKRYSGSVGEPIIRDLYGVVTSERANKGILITSGYFTSSAIKFANDKPIELIDGNKLNALLNNYGLANFNEINNRNGHYFGSFSIEYTKYKSSLKENPLDYEALQKLIHLFMQAIIHDTMSGIYNPNKQIYDEAIDECDFYLSRIMLCQTPQCVYTVNYCKCILHFLKGDINQSYIYSKHTLEVISNHIKDTYSLEEMMSIVAIAYNHIQLALLLNLDAEANNTYEKWQNFFLQRIEELKSQIADDSLDWADPDEDINDILEFMESQNEDAIKEINFLTNPFTLSNIYLVTSFLFFYSSKIPKDDFSLSLFDEYNIAKTSFEKENEKVIGINGFPKWDNYYICKS